MKIEIDYIIEAVKTLRQRWWRSFTFIDEDYSSMKYENYDGAT
jgi:hypothetical protein